MITLTFTMGLLVASAPSHAVRLPVLYLTTQDLDETCSKADPFSRGLCAGYMRTMVGEDRDPQARIKGQELHETCGKEDPFSKGFCQGSIVGANDLWHRKGLEGLTGATNGVCMPHEVLAGQLVAVMKKWMRDRPETWHYVSDRIFLDAILEAFPCPEQRALRDKRRR